MAQQFLDDTGLSALWNKIKAWAAPKSHTHSYLPLSGGSVTGALTIDGDNAQLNVINALANITNSQIIAQNSELLIPDDFNISVAGVTHSIGEVFSGSSVDESNLVHLSGAETITGVKTFNANINMNTHKITNLDTPSAGGDAANKNYVDGSLGGYKIQVVTALPSSPNTNTIYFVR